MNSPRCVGFRHFLSMPKHSRWDHERPLPAPEIWCCRYSGWIFPANLDCKPLKIRHFPFHRLPILPIHNIGSPKAFHKNHRESATRSVNPHNSGQRPMWTTNDRLVTKLGGFRTSPCAGTRRFGAPGSPRTSSVSWREFCCRRWTNGSKSLFYIFFWAIQSTTRNWFWNALIMWTPWVPANNQLWSLCCPHFGTRLGPKPKTWPCIIFPPSFSAFIPLDLCAASRRMGYHGIPHIAIDYHWC